jgi:hypothetical protein
MSRYYVAAEGFDKVGKSVMKLSGFVSADSHAEAERKKVNELRNLKPEVVKVSTDTSLFSY